MGNDVLKDVAGMVSMHRVSRDVILRVIWSKVAEGKIIGNAINAIGRGLR